MTAQKTNRGPTVTGGPRVVWRGDEMFVLLAGFYQHRAGYARPRAERAAIEQMRAFAGIVLTFPLLTIRKDEHQ